MSSSTSIRSPGARCRNGSASSTISTRASSPIGSASRAIASRSKSNWNIAINSFSEGYHAAYVHRKTVPDYQGGKQNPQRHRAYLEITEHHGRYSAQANPNRRVTDVEQIAYAHGRPLYPSFPPFSETGLPLPPGVNASRNENWGFDVAEVFPVLIWIIGAHWHANLWFWPISEDKTDVRVEFFAYKAETVGDALAHAYFRTRLREVFREDVGTMEQVTKALKSGAMQQHHAVAAGAVAAAALRGGRRDAAEPVMTTRLLPKQFSALSRSCRTGRCRPKQNAWPS